MKAIYCVGAALLLIEAAMVLGGCFGKLAQDFAALFLCAGTITALLTAAVILTVREK
jgi:hypothetical protein